MSCEEKFLEFESIGGTNWMAALLWLEQLGLDLRRDNITIQPIGDQIVRSQALESGKVDAAAIDTVLAKRLEQRGFTMYLGDAHKIAVRTVAICVDVVLTRACICGTARYSGKHSKGTVGKPRLCSLAKEPALCLGTHHEAAEDF